MGAPLKTFLRRGEAPLKIVLRRSEAPLKTFLRRSEAPLKTFLRRSEAPLAQDQTRPNKTRKKKNQKTFRNLGTMIFEKSMLLRFVHKSRAVVAGVLLLQTASGMKFRSRPPTATVGEPSPAPSLESSPRSEGRPKATTRRATNPATGRAVGSTAKTVAAAVIKGLNEIKTSLRDRRTDANKIWYAFAADVDRMASAGMSKSDIARAISTPVDPQEAELKFREANDRIRNTLEELKRFSMLYEAASDGHIIKNSLRKQPEDFRTKIKKQFLDVQARHVNACNGANVFMNFLAEAQVRKS